MKTCRKTPMHHTMVQQTHPNAGPHEGRKVRCEVFSTSSQHTLVTKGNIRDTDDLSGKEKKILNRVNTQESSRQ